MRLWRSRFHRRPGSPPSCALSVHEPADPCRPSPPPLPNQHARPLGRSFRTQSCAPFGRGDGAGLGLARARRTGRDPKNAPPSGALTGHRTVAKCGGLLAPLSILRLCALLSGFALNSLRSGYFDRLTPAIWLKRTRIAKFSPRKAGFHARVDEMGLRMGQNGP